MSDFDLERLTMLKERVDELAAQETTDMNLIAQLAWMKGFIDSWMKTEPDDCC